MTHRSMLTAIGFTAFAALTLGGCLVAARPGYYHPTYGTYGYTTVAAPNTVYYRGGYHSGVYYRPGYYYNSAPFVARPVYTAPPAQPSYGYGGYGGVSGGVATPVGGVSGAVIVR